MDGINDSRVMLLVFSRHSNRSPHVWREVERAVSRNIPLLQLRLEDIRPSRALELFVSSSHWLDAFPPPAEPHLETLPAKVRRLIIESRPTEEREAIRLDELHAEQSARRARAASGLRKFRRPSAAMIALLTTVLVGVTALTLATNTDWFARSQEKSSTSNDSITPVDSLAKAPSPDSQPAPAPPPASPPPAETAATKKTGNGTGTSGKTTGAATVRNPPPSTTIVRDTTSRNTSGPVIPIRPPDPSALAEVARVCVTALLKRDSLWLTNHYGTNLTVVDEKNVKTLSDLLRNKAYEAQVLSNPVAADGAVNFTMQFQFSTPFGTTLTRKSDFQVQTVMRNGNPELANCRVKGTLKL